MKPFSMGRTAPGEALGPERGPESFRPGMKRFGADGAVDAPAACLPLMRDWAVPAKTWPQVMFKAGDTFMVPIGMGYQWQNDEYVKKIFCSYTP